MTPARSKAVVTLQKLRARRACPSKFFAHLLQLSCSRGPLVDRPALAVGQLFAVGAVERRDLVERGAHGAALPEAGWHAARVHERADRVGLDAVAVAGRDEGRARRPREARDGAVVDLVRAQVERERRSAVRVRGGRVLLALAASSACTRRCRWRSPQALTHARQALIIPSSDPGEMLP